MHIPIVEGRNFTEADNEDDKSPAVMIVNEAFVRASLQAAIPSARVSMAGEAGSA